MLGLPLVAFAMIPKKGTLKNEADPFALSGF